jgi:hypothetical protein
MLLLQHLGIMWPKHTKIFLLVVPHYLIGQQAWGYQLIVRTEKYDML